MHNLADDRPLSREDLLACALAIPPPDPAPHDLDDEEYDRYYNKKIQYCKNLGKLFFAASRGSEEGKDAYERCVLKPGFPVDFWEEWWWESFLKSPPANLTPRSLIDFTRTTAKDRGIWFELPSEMSARAGGGMPEVIDVATLEGQEPCARDFLIEDMIPTRTVILLTGKAGLGKSLLAMQAAECLRRGDRFLGRTTTPCTTLIYSCEDDRDELHRRHARMVRGLGLVSDCPGRLLFLPRVGTDNALAVHDSRSGRMVPTPSYHELRRIVLENNVRLIVVDTVAQTFTGSENDRGQVTTYVNVLSGLAQEINGAVLLISHPPKSEAEYSGSTGWDGTVRARLFLHEVEKDGQRRQYLKLAKANYAQRFEIEICPDNHGVWHLAGVRRQGRAGEEEARHLGEGKAIFLDALDKLTDQGRALSDLPRATNYAPKLIVRAGLGQQRSVEELGQAMEALFAAGEITANGVVGRRPNRSTIKGIVRLTQEPQGSQQDPAPAAHDVDELVEEVDETTG